MAVGLSVGRHGLRLEATYSPLAHHKRHSAKGMQWDCGRVSFCPGANVVIYGSLAVQCFERPVAPNTIINSPAQLLCHHPEGMLQWWEGHGQEISGTTRKHDDVLTWRRCPHYSPLMRGIHPWPVNPLEEKRPIMRRVHIFLFRQLNKPLNTLIDDTRRL